MDLASSVLYRGVNLNSVDTQPGGKRSGILLEEVNYSRTPGQGYREKRAQDDGYDATDVFLGMRPISMTGTVYGYSPGDLWDQLQLMRSALTPSAAYLEAPAIDGYLPLQFYEPTNLTSDFPSGIRQLQINARPVSQPDFAVRRDTGAFGRGGKGGAISFQAVLEAKDPRIYVWPGKTQAFSATEAGTLVNRGDYPSPLGITFKVAAASPAGNILFEVGGQRMRITVEDDTVLQTYRYDGNLKILTVEKNSVEALRRDLLTFLSNTTHPKVPPGSSAYTITVTAVTNITQGSMFYSEAFA
jgi:hypothetical protein